MVGSFLDGKDSFAAVAEYCFMRTGQQSISEFVKYGVGVNSQVSIIPNEKTWMVYA